jgi:protein-disulfide isomerase
MNARFASALALVAALALGAAGYLLGVRNGAAPAGLTSEQKSAIAAIVKESMPATPVPAPAATPIARPMGTDVVQMAELSKDQQSEVEAIIRNYLIANPEIVRDAINELQRREDAAAQEAQSKAIADAGDQIFTSNRQVVLGNPNGNVTLVEFFDYNCTYCRRAQADMQKLIEADPNLRIVLKEFPVLGDGSVEAAKVAVAVHLTAPDKYGAFHDELLGEPGQVNAERALAVATDVGVDAAAVKAKMESDEVKDTIAEVYDLAGKLNLSGTPSYVTRKEVIVGAVGYDALKGKIEEARACGATC